MNPIAEEILMHYGTPRHSGRYPWGSGGDPYQRTGDFLSRIEGLKKTGWTESAENIKSEFGLTVKQYRNEKAWANYERRLNDVERAKSLKADGKGATEIGREMGLTESTVRSLLNPNSEAKMNEAKKTADFLKKQVDEKGMIDVGSGVERELNISKERLDQALYGLEREGYMTFGGRMSQVTNPNQKTTLKVLCPPGTPYKVNEKGQKVSSEIYNLDKIHSVKDYISRDGGETYEKKFHYPESLDSKRLMIRYKEDGGIDKDGVVELRRNVPDLSLGESKYSQVRIMVDGKKYIKGMAVYSDDMPDGVDVIFNTNKSKSVPKMEVLKDIKSDPDNPFGSLIKDADQGGQYWYTDKNGKKKLGLINKRSDEGDWTDWQDSLPSQFLTKQSTSLAKKQLDIAKADKQEEFDAIMSLNNPTVKKYYLEKFADSCDSAAVHLKAAALPGQKYHVILPVTSLKDTEVYAPGYKDGEKLALIRYPHGGTFEIPILTVNNKNRDAEKMIGKTSIDAVGINSKVAERLSGADFDGDTVMCIPTHDRQGKVKIDSTKPLKGLEGFDPKIEYGPETYKGRTVKLMTKTDTEMGKISNLITDMTLSGGASPDELARAVRHSMVVIDAEKHKLDYKKSEMDNDIASLRKKYQAHVDSDGRVRYGGASTIISRAKGETTVEKRQGQPRVNLKGKDWYDPSKPEGALIYKKADDLYYPERKYDKKTGIMELKTIDGKKISYDVKDKQSADNYAPIKKVDPKTGDVVFTNKTGDVTYKTMTRTQKSTRMAETDDATTLVSDAKHPMELLYADYANSMKSLANRARKEEASAGKIEYSRSAAETYKKEVVSLNDKLKTALLNAPRERAANRMAIVEVTSKTNTNPDMKPKDIKKANQQALTKYRNEVGSVLRRDRNIIITDREWEAIQAGAVSENVLKKILDNSDTNSLRERAMPKQSKTLNQAKISKIKAMSASYTIQQIAEAMNLSPSTVSKYLKGA